MSKKTKPPSGQKESTSALSRRAILASLGAGLVASGAGKAGATPIDSKTIDYDKDKMYIVGFDKTIYLPLENKDMSVKYYSKIKIGKTDLHETLEISCLKAKPK
jgi:hypothetical protein